MSLPLYHKKNKSVSCFILLTNLLYEEDAFAERIVEAVEKKVISNLPTLFGMYMAQMQAFPLSVPMGAYPVAQGGMVYGQALENGTNNGNAVMSGTVSPIASNPANSGAVVGRAQAFP